MQTPATRFRGRGRTNGGDAEPDTSALADDRAGEDWVSRRVASNGVVSVSWQQISVGKHRAGHPEILQLWDGAELLKTVTRASRGEVRKKRASRA